MNIGLFSSVKNEGPFLLEWVAYHRMIGFDHILIFSNDSTDGTTELLDALDGAGAITHVLQDLALGDVPQHTAANAAFDHPALAASDWLMWLDADEFLFCNSNTNNVSELIDTIDEKTGGVCVNWLNFGNNDRANWEPGLVTSQFTRRGEDTASRHVMFKTLFRRVPEVRGFGIHRPFLTAQFQGAGYQLVNSAGTPMHADVYRSGAFKRHALGNAPMDLVAHDQAAVFHYAVKTRDCFLAKRARGQGSKPAAAEDRASRFKEKYWMVYNRNEVEDLRLAQLSQRIQTEMDVWLDHPDVAAAHADSLARYAAMLSG